MKRKIVNQSRDDDECVPEGGSDDGNELKPGTEMVRSNLEEVVGRIAMGEFVDEALETKKMKKKGCVLMCGRERVK